MNQIQKETSREQKRETKEFEDKDTSSLDVLKSPLPAKEHDYCTTSRLDPERWKAEDTQHRPVDLESTDLQCNMLISKDKAHGITDIPKNSEEGDEQKELSPVSQGHTSTFVPHPGSIFPFNTPDYRFECICGELGLVDYKARVQCLNCHLWQHAECVNYKEENLKIKPFYCPHCLVAMKPVPTGATLIISPSSICHQWVDEINRHVRSSSLRVLVRLFCRKECWMS